MDEELIRIIVIIVFLAFSFVGRLLKKKGQQRTEEPVEQNEGDIFEQLKDIINAERQAQPSVDEFENLEPQEIEEPPVKSTDSPWYHRPSYLKDEPEHETGLAEIHNVPSEEMKAFAIQKKKVHPLMKDWDPKKAILYAEILKRPNH